MRCLIFLIFLIAIFMLLLIDKRQKNVFGGDIRNEYRISIEQKLTSCKKKDARDIANNLMDTIYENYGDNPFLLASKVDNIVNKCKIEECTSLNDILEFIGIYQEPQNIYKEDKEEDIYCDLYECPRCKGENSIVKEVVRRSIDEPADVLATCQQCGQKFNVD